MNINEIKEAVGKVKETGMSCVLSTEEVYALIDLAHLVIECSGVMPEKKTKCRICIPYEFCGCNNDTHNQAIDDMTLALTKKMMGLEGVVINDICKFIDIDGSFKITPFERDLARHLAKMFRNHMLGGK